MALASCSSCPLSFTLGSHNSNIVAQFNLRLHNAPGLNLHLKRCSTHHRRTLLYEHDLRSALRRSVSLAGAGRIPFRGLRFRKRRNKLVLVQAQSSENEGAESGQGQGNEEENWDSERSMQGAAAELSYFRIKEAIATGTRRYWGNLWKDLRNDTGIDMEALERVYNAVILFLNRRREEATVLVQNLQARIPGYRSEAVSVADTVRLKLWPQFVSWNRWEYWKDVKKWDSQRIGALLMYILLAAASLRALNISFRNPRQSAESLANAYMEAVIPEPTQENVQKLRKGLWREQMPKGLCVHKYVEGFDGEYHLDPSYIGENPWRDDGNVAIPEDVNKIIDDNGTLSKVEKDTMKVLASAAVDLLRGKRQIPVEGDQRTDLAPVHKGRPSWQERLTDWEEILEAEKHKDGIDSHRSKYVTQLDWREIQKNFFEERKRQTKFEKPRGYVMARKWWKYRPKLPYTYFLSKVESLEVEAAVYSEDTRKLFVTMKEGFPSEYVVDVPVDPYLHELMMRCGVNLDIMPQSNWYYYLRALAILAPNLMIIFYVRYFTSRAQEMTSEKIIDLLKMNREHLILPEDAAQKAKSEYKDVVVGRDVWQVLEEIMTYMRNPMKFHTRRVKLPRGILISGPPGTGKTLLARAIARESGLPFVFASGAEFVESSTGDGAEKVFDIFFTARANAPAFVFIDEIDALAGKGVNDDPERKSTFEQLLAELDGEPEDTDLYRFSHRQAVILICATNRPDELDERLLRPGRIDREIHIGLPGERERIDIFDVHSTGRRFSKDVDFTKIVFRTVGYSGADIRNLINEAGIMAVRRGREVISQGDFIDVLDKQLFEGLGLVLTEEEQKRAEEKVSSENKRLMAVHEAGHVLLAHLFPHFDWHAFSHLLPGGKETALSVFYPRQEMLTKGYTTVGYLKMQMVVAHGGRCAERIVFGDDLTDGGQDDLARISKIAREIAISVASPRLGLFPLIWKDNFDPPVPADEVELVPNNWEDPGTRIANMSVEFSEMFTREVTRYIDETEEEAMRALATNRHILERLAVELFERTKISGLDIAEIVESMNPVMLQDPLKLPDMNLDITESLVPPNSLGRYEHLDIYQAPLHRC